MAPLLLLPTRSSPTYKHNRVQALLTRKDVIASFEQLLMLQRMWRRAIKRKIDKRHLELRTKAAIKIQVSMLWCSGVVVSVCLCANVCGGGRWLCERQQAYCRMCITAATPTFF